MVSHTSFLGGAERGLLELARAFRDSTAFGACIACPENGPLEDEAVADRICTARMPTAKLEGITGICAVLRKIPRVARGVLTLWAHVRKKKAALIHANGIKACLPAVVASRLARIPCVWHVRDYPRRPRLHRLLACLSHALIVPTQFMADALAKSAGVRHDCLRIIPNGVAAPLIDEAKMPGFREEVGVASEDLLVTLVAQLVPWKRHDLFIEAAAQLLSRRTDLHFLIVGSDPWGLNRAYQKMLVERAKEPKLAGRVKFLGQRSDVGTILAASDIVILPSENEPFGRVVVESWWAGTPVVATNQGGPAEIIEDGVTGLLFRKGDAKDLARQMGRLAADASLRKQLAERAKTAATRYGVLCHAAAVAGLYRELVG